MVLEQTQLKLKTSAFLEWSNLPENRDKLFELIDGEIVEKMASFTPSKIAVWIATYINIYLLKNPIGSVTGADGTYAMSDENAFIPDVGYISKVRMPDEPDREAPVPPDLAVEVMSPTDSKRALRRKAEGYLQFGTVMVWLVFPDTQTVEVYYRDQDVVTFGVNDALDGMDVLPGFMLKISDIFV